MSEAVIELEGLGKCFGTHAALDGLDLRVPAGSVFGFLGRNGAGKTTAIKHLLGLLKADRGCARIFGQPVADPGAGGGSGAAAWSSSCCSCSPRPASFRGPSTSFEVST